MADIFAQQKYGTTRAEWIANLNTEYTPPKQFRRTSIICTIGTFQQSQECKIDVSEWNADNREWQAPRPTRPTRSTCSAKPA